ncbi:MAG: hypothetical protein LAT82_00395 [Nanoarchaeota archaeon]|nr:hypothetical protein [Nanoarchaeota archaeon]
MELIALIKKLNFLLSNYKYLVGGFLFLFLQLFIYIANMNSESMVFYYWYCNHIPILFSLAFFFKQYQVVKGLIGVGLIPQVLWILDLMLYGLFSYQLFGFTQYFFELESSTQMISVLIIHVFSSLLAFLLTISVKPNYKSLITSLVYVLFLQLITLIFTDPSLNINCVQEICGLENFTPLLYKYYFFILTFIVMVLPSYFIQIGVFNIYKKYKKNKNII